MTLQAAKEAATTWSADERREFASHLLELNEPPAPSPEEYKRLWKAVIARRIEEMDNGTAKMIPHEVVMKELRERYS